MGNARQPRPIASMPDMRDRLFHAFVQADATTTRRVGGTGLGLAISRQLAELMGGSIGFDSTLGNGSTFWFTVVVERTGPLEIAAPTIERSLVGLRALVVDDNRTNRRILLQQLRLWEMQVDSAEDGPQAIALARAAAVGQRSDEGPPLTGTPQIGRYAITTVSFAF